MMEKLKSLAQVSAYCKGVLQFRGITLKELSRLPDDHPEKAGRIAISEAVRAEMQALLEVLDTSGKVRVRSAQGEFEGTLVFSKGDTVRLIDSVMLSGVTDVQDISGKAELSKETLEEIEWCAAEQFLSEVPEGMTYEQLIALLESDDQDAISEAGVSIWCKFEYDDPSDVAQHIETLRDSIQSVVERTL